MQNQIENAPMASVNPLLGLSKLQLDRYYSVFYRYNNDALLLVKSVKARGKNSWQPVLVRSDYVNRTQGDQRKYFRALIDAFEIDVPIPNSEIVQTVSEIRSRYGLEHFTDSITTQCLNEFANVFVFEEDTYTHSDGSTFKGVKPLFALLAE